MSFSTCSWPSAPIFGNRSHQIMLYIMWVIHFNFHYVDLWLTFQRLTYVMSYGTIGINTSRKMVLLLMHYIANRSTNSRS
jgi:hypothetical protein